MKREGPRDHVHSHILIEAFSVRKYTRKELVIGHICEANCNIIISIDSIIDLSVQDFTPAREFIDRKHFKVLFV